MISIETINADIIAQIKAAFPAIPFPAQEDIEKITRPAFKLILDEIKSERYSSGSVKRIYPVELVYFAADKQRPKIECLGIYEQLEPILYKTVDKLDASIDSQNAILMVDFEILEIGELTAAADTTENIQTLEIMEDLN